MRTRKSRPPYVADVEGRARIEGVAASMHESYLHAHGNKVAEDAVFKTPCVVIIFDEAPRYREVQSKYESKHPIMQTFLVISFLFHLQLRENRLGETVEANQLLELWSLTKNLFWGAKWPNARSEVIQIQIVGIFWGWQ